MAKFITREPFDLDEFLANSSLFEFFDEAVPTTVTLTKVVATNTTEGTEQLTLTGTFSAQLDEDGYPTPDCAEWLIQATDFTCEEDGRDRLIIWPDKSSTSLALGQDVRHYPPPQHRHLSRHGWPPMRPN